MTIMRRIRVGMQGMECECRGFSVGMLGVWVKMREMGGIRVAMQRIKIET